MVYRRLNKDDAERSNPLFRLPPKKRKQHSFRWRVYEKYELVEDGDNTYMQAAKTERAEPPLENRWKPKCVCEYDPLIDAPRLFLDFAQIEEEKEEDQPLALVSWIHKYGLLGLSEENAQYDSITDHFDAAVGRRFWRSMVSSTYSRYEDRGGPADSFAALWDWTEEANECLNLYKAALDRNQKNLERLLHLDKNFQEECAKRRRQITKGRSLEEEEYYDYGYLEHLESQRESRKEAAARLGSSWLDYLVYTALSELCERVSGVLSEFTYPRVVLPDSLGPHAADQLSRGWGARNLLGAMYIQFYWLITAGAELSRCRYCNSFISYGPSRSGSGDRKTRNDKAFCNKQCRQNYHYHVRRKHKD